MYMDIGRHSILFHAIIAARAKLFRQWWSLRAEMLTAKYGPSYKAKTIYHRHAVIDAPKVEMAYIYIAPMRLKLSSR